MDRLEFKTFEDFACEIADKFDDIIKINEYNDVAVIAKHDEIKEIFRELVCLGYDLCNIALKMVDWDGYDDEYILSISSEGIWIEKFKRENGYFEDESTIIYVLDNCSSKVIPYCKGKMVYEASVGEIDEKSGSENYVVNGKSVSKEEFDKYVAKFKHDEKPTTTSTVSLNQKSVYKVNGKEVSKEEYDKTVHKIEDKYLDNMRDMLLRYSSWMEEVDEYLKMFHW